ncbi:hypothetical protein Anas_05609 [Armadillidium nasatum]|uniref:Chitin-binding type-2 domain-containing protein n=1 Tax=Armadillidium nasatum TaxID=96803 RepID=A0A5N5SKE4_9CRUS|nr:hypothetical protein Anas_05609 [Armadillidium nasatum]
MLNRNILYFLIPLIFAVCLSISPSNYNYGAYPIQDCSENASFSGYCLDCETERVCHAGDNGTLILCSQSQKDFNGDRYIFECPAGEYYDDDLQECYLPAPTTTTTKAPNPCSVTGGEVIGLNCTCYRYCLGGDSFYDECCNPGEIYDEVTLNCDFYYPFSCTGKTDGEYVDPHNCSVYHICVGEAIFATQTCTFPDEFDEDKQECTDDTTVCDAIVDCGICPDEDTYIKIDCYNYYECEKNEDAAEGDPEFEPVLKYCPEGTCFNSQTTFCDLAP